MVIQSSKNSLNRGELSNLAQWTLMCFSGGLKN
nr:MAG TPA: hypothetical protein [Caudoviricetes sp.]